MKDDARTRRENALEKAGISSPPLCSVILPMVYCGAKYRSIMTRTILKAANIPPRTAARFRLREMFIAGGVAAGLACRYIYGRRRGSGGFRVYRLLFSLWSNYLIMADAASDTRELDQKSSTSFLRACCGEIIHPMLAIDPALPELADSLLSSQLGWGTGPEREFEWETASPFGEAALLLSRRFGAVAACCLSRGASPEFIRASFELFLQRVMALVQGQCRSLEQSVLDDSHDWNWYRNNVLDAKFTNILLAPLVLLADSELRAVRRRNVERGLALVNTLFLHRQLMDDLLDMQSDCEDGILGGPAYLLLSLPGEGGREELSRPFPRSDLHDLPGVVASRLRRRGRESLAYEMENAEAFRALWPKDRRAAASVLLSSGAVREIMAILEDSERTTAVLVELKALLHQESGIGDAIGFYYYRCSRSFGKLKASLGLTEAPPV